MHAKTRDRLENILGANIKNLRSVSGGDIAQAYLIETTTEKLFCKVLHGKSAFEMLRAEMEGLDRIRNTGTIKSPRVYFCEDLGEEACLGMEYIESKSPLPGDMQRLGELLAALHQTSSEKFGYARDNFIGSLPQSNREHASWTSFYIRERLVPQFEMALSGRLMHEDEIPKTENMVEVLSPYLNGVSPALLHGDLWSGNYLISATGEPYLIDPAVYYGDPAVDLAMSRLFGGFGEDFYHSYEANAGVYDNEEHKTPLYQLYYLLVHLNLFGRSYYGSVKGIMKRYF